MIGLIHRLRSYRPKAIRLAGIFWLFAALNSFYPCFATTTSEFPFKVAFHNHHVALLVCGILCTIRGMIALINTKRYWRMFRATLFKKTQDPDRIEFLMMCTTAWFCVALFTDFSLPLWLILWGFFAWFNTRVPFVDAPPENVAFNPCIHPFTGLPMINGIDIAGNPLGYDPSWWYRWYRRYNLHNKYDED